MTQAGEAVPHDRDGGTQFALGGRVLDQVPHHVQAEVRFGLGHLQQHFHRRRELARVAGDPRVPAQLFITIGVRPSTSNRRPSTGRTRQPVGGQPDHPDIWASPTFTAADFLRKSAVLDHHCAAIGRDPAEITRSAQVFFTAQEPPAAGSSRFPQGRRRP
jgi:hypothetical protein